MLNLTLPFTATRLQATTYLLGVCLFSISFLVFLNSAISFVVTDRIGQKTRVGNAVGTLGFADELVALVACPVWGVLSDRIGVRTVAVAGYAIVGVSLYVTVQARNVFPELLLARLLFSVGGAATTTMVTAILPSMTSNRNPEVLPGFTRRANGSPAHATTPSISSELTITPDRYSSSRSPTTSGTTVAPQETSSPKLAGIVGMLTGCGALVALGVFLPLPTRFQGGGTSPSQSIADSFYVVGFIALCVSLFCFFGLRRLPGEDHKGLKRLFTMTKPGSILQEMPMPSYFKLLYTSIGLGFKDVHIGLGYVGGFVARASSVAISLFIPLYVNTYYIKSGLCPENPSESTKDPNTIKENCKQAYIVASMLTGVSQLIALLCAPIFGYLCGIYTNHNLPLLLASACGVAGYSIFGRLKSPDPFSDEGNVGVFFIVALLGISQIGAIVCSLSMLARGIASEGVDGPNHSIPSTGTAIGSDHCGLTATEESSPLMPSHFRQIGDESRSRAALKGSIAGIYSLAGGAGILLLTKIGGLMFDKIDQGTPFFMMAIFNAVLLVVTGGCDLWAGTKVKQTDPTLAGVQEQDEENYRDDG